MPPLRNRRGHIGVTTLSRPQLEYKADIRRVREARAI